MRIVLLSLISILFSQNVLATAEDGKPDMNYITTAAPFSITVFPSLVSAGLLACAKGNLAGREMVNCHDYKAIAATVAIAAISITNPVYGALTTIGGSYMLDEIEAELGQQLKIAKNDIAEFYASGEKSILIDAMIKDTQKLSQSSANESEIVEAISEAIYFIENNRN